jgi:hypothetical protein
MITTTQPQNNTFAPTSKQRQAHRLLQQNRVVLYGGAIRGAKSYWGCMEIISLCYKYPNSRWLMLRKTLPVLKATLLKTFRENFLDKGWGQYVVSFPQSTMVLRWANGSEIVFMSESYDDDKELNRFKGLEINGAFIDEVNEIQEVTYHKVLERAGSWFHSAGCPVKILMSCNPSQNWVKEKFYNRWKNGTLPPDHAYLHANIFDNPHLPQQYIRSLETLPRYQYEVYVQGNWDIAIKTGGEFYKCFDPEKHVAPVSYNPALPLHISWDDNVNPYLPCGIFQIEGTALRMIDEVCGTTPGNTIQAVCNEIMRRYPAHNAGMFVYGDATANRQDTRLEKGYNFYRLVLDNLQQYRPVSRVTPSNPPVVMRGNWLNTVFEKQYGGLSITIGTHCKHTINDLILLKEAPDGTKLKEQTTDPTTGARCQKYGHFSDLLDYLCCSAFAAQFAQYQAGSITAKPAYGRNTGSKNAY